MCPPQDVDARLGLKTSDLDELVESRKQACYMQTVMVTWKVEAAAFGLGPLVAEAEPPPAHHQVSPS